MRRLAKLRSTAPPTFLEAVNPKREGLPRWGRAWRMNPGAMYLNEDAETFKKSRRCFSVCKTII